MIKNKKIAFVAPGEIDIPPNGWGALETVVWNQKQQLDKLGYDTIIINNPDTNETYKLIQEYNPAIVHLHYGKHFEVLPHLNMQKIITNHDGSFINSISFHENIIRKFMYDCKFFILTTWEKQLLEKIGFHRDKICILPNGVDTGSFAVHESPKYPERSICLGKIDQRKNQTDLQKLQISIDFVGQNADPSFNPLDSHYLGMWSRDDVYQKLTHYTNLVLLSRSELQPLVCLEALVAGLGLVISEACSQNLDTSVDFIDVIPNNMLTNYDYIKQVILNNRSKCLSVDRKSIIRYAASFDWSQIALRYQQYL